MQIITNVTSVLYQKLLFVVLLSLCSWFLVTWGSPVPNIQLDFYGFLTGPIVGENTERTHCVCRGPSPPRAKIKPSECESAVFTVKHGPDDFLSFQRSQHPEAAQEEQHPPPARPRWALSGGGRNGRLLRGSSGVSEPPPPSPGQIQEEELPASHPHPPPYPRYRFREHRLPAGLDPSSLLLFLLLCTWPRSPRGQVQVAGRPSFICSSLKRVSEADRVTCPSKTSQSAPIARRQPQLDPSDGAEPPSLSETLTEVSEKGRDTGPASSLY